MKVQDKFPRTAGTFDPRTRRSLTPCRVVTTAGCTENAQALTAAKPVQVSLSTPYPSCVLKNEGDGTRAAVLLDFGMELHGTVAVSVGVRSQKAPQKEYGNEAKILIRAGESVTEALTPVGEHGATNDHAAREITLPFSGYSTNETPETGFRFAYIELLSPDTMVELRAVTAVLILRDLEYIGSFSSSDPLLEKIYDTAAYTVHLNMQRYLWDGIKRDRLVWAGDMNTEVNTILAVFGSSCCDVVQRSLDFVRDITPIGEPMNSIAAYNLWWLLCHYDWYMTSGDLAYLREQKDYLSAMLPHYLRMIDENGSETVGGFFDWPSQGHAQKSHAGRQGLFRYALSAAAEIFTTLGDESLARECALGADKLLRHNPDPDGYKQAAAMLALSHIADPGEILEKTILPGGAEGLSTFLGYFTLLAAAEAGRTDAALTLIREYWGRMLDMGATTFWEDFDIRWTENAHRIDELPIPGKADIHGDFGAFCYKNFRHSLCHGWASGPAPFLAKHVLGIRPFAPGMKAVRFAPDLGGLEWAKGTVPTPHGVITVELERAKDGRTLGKFDAPDGVDVIVK